MNRRAHRCSLAKGAIELEIRLPRAHGDMDHRDEQQIVDVDFARPDSPLQLRARFHLAVSVLLHQPAQQISREKMEATVTYFDEALDRLSHVLREFGLGDRTRGAPEITRGYLPAPWLVSLPLRTRQHEQRGRRKYAKTTIKLYAPRDEPRSRARSLGRAAHRGRAGA